MFSPAKALELDKSELAIGIARGRFGGHAGIAFQSAKDGLQILHLRWHRKLAVEPYNATNDCWIVCKLEIPSSLAVQLVGIVRAVAKRLPQINYAVDSIAGKGSFDSNGTYKPPRGSVGLTCASFVTEVFRAGKAPLLREETWTSTEANVLWAKQVVALLRELKVDSHHIAAVEKSINGIRIRPEEVGAAATLPFRSRAADFETLNAISPHVMATLDVQCPVARQVAVAAAQPPMALVPATDNGWSRGG